MNRGRWREADRAMRRALNAVDGDGFFGLHLPRFWRSRWDAALREFRVAADGYRTSGDWPRCGQALEWVARCQVETRRELEGAASLMQAAEAFDHVEPIAARWLRAEAVDAYVRLGQAGTAALDMRRLGDAAREAGRLDDAVAAYERAATLWGDGTAEAIDVRVEVARIRAEFGEFRDAADAFERAARWRLRLQDGGGARCAWRLLLDAGCCLLAVASYAELRDKLRAYEELAGGGTEECTALEAMIAGLEKNEERSFVEALSAHAAVIGIPSWRSRVLDKARDRTTCGSHGHGSPSDDSYFED